LTKNWKKKVRGRIQRADIVIILCGEKTHVATGVAYELRVAKELNKPFFLLKGYPERKCTKPRTAGSGDKMYEWSWNNLKALIDGER
jgi:hypothetical protein